MFWEIYYFCLVAILGLLIGSFLNVCIYRIPLKESIAKGSSHCTSCQMKIKRYDLIPVFSWIFLGGKCRNCKSKISPRYPLIELLNCLMYILIYWTCGMNFKTLLFCALSSVLIVITMIDIDTGEIPNGLIIFILCLSPLVLLLNDMPI
ncbi:MAG: prepilin peptidase, partial [Oscillospiraceae bacterium]